MLRAFGLAVAAWWKALINFAIINVLWIGFSLTIIGGPPALAALYQLAANTVEGEYADWRAFFGAMKRLFVPAWRWGLLQLVVYGVTGFNFLFYSVASGSLIAALRIVWGIGLTVWTVLNLFYWPFYLQQEDQRMTTTYRNVLVLIVTQPGLALGVTVGSAVIVALSVLTVILFAFAVLPLLALLATFAVQGPLLQYRTRQAR